MPATTPLTRNTIVGVKEETTEGTYNAPGAGDVVQMDDIPLEKPEIEKVDRNLVKGSLGMMKPLAGVQRGSIELGYEARAAGATANVSDEPEATDLLKNALGRKKQGVNTTTHATNPSTASVIELVSSGGAGFEKWDVVFILGEVRVITAITGDQITLNQALTKGAPAAGTPVRGGWAYKPAQTGYTHLSVAIWRDAETSGLLFRGMGCKTERLTFEGIEVGQIPKVKQTLQMLTHAYQASQSAPASPVWEDQEPPLAFNGILARADVAIPVAKMELEIANTLAKEPDINAAGGYARMFVTKRDITGKIDPLMDKASVAIQDAWRNNDSFELFMVLGKKDGSGDFIQGSCIVVYMPTVIFTGNEPADQDGLMKAEMPFRAHESNSPGDDEIVVAFI